MAQTPHPLDLEVEEMYETYSMARRVFERDQTIDADEHMVLTLISSHYRDIASYRQREELADSFKRNGLSRVTKDRARDAGFQIVDLETERRKRGDNVIPFPSHCDETA